MVPGLLAPFGVTAPSVRSWTSGSVPLTPIRLEQAAETWFDSSAFLCQFVVFPLPRHGQQLAVSPTRLSWERSHPVAFLSQLHGVPRSLWLARATNGLVGLGGWYLLQAHRNTVAPWKP